MMFGISRLMAAALTVCSVEPEGGKPAGGGGGEGDKGKPADGGKGKEGAPVDDGEDDPDDDNTDEKEINKPKFTIADMQKVRGEAKKHRLEAKAAKEQLAEQEKALAALGLKRVDAKDKQTDPVAEAKKSNDQKLRNALVRSSIAVLAPDVQNAASLFKIAPELFKDVTVDVDADHVDEEEMKEALKVARTEHAYMFRTDKKVPTGNLPVDGGGRPINGDSHYAQWKKLKEAGRNTEAQNYYTKNIVQIRAEIKANPNLV